MKLNDIILGDCLELMKDIPNGSIDCVVTDPPYTVTKSGDYKGTGFINGHWREDKNTSNRNAKNGKIFKENEIKFSDPLWIYSSTGRANEKISIFLKLNYYD